MFKRQEPRHLPPSPTNKELAEKNPFLAPHPEGEDIPVITTEVSVVEATNKLGTIAEGRAKRLLQRLQKGETLSVATTNERMSVAELKDPTNLVRASVQQLIGTYFLPPEARKQLVRAHLNKVVVDNINSKDPAMIKLALDADKMISLDPEVGLQQDNSGGVIINIGELASVFSQLQSAKVPEVSDGRSGDDRVLQAEYEDVTEPGNQSESLPNVPGGLGTGDKSEVVSGE